MGKLWARVYCLVFFTHGVSITLLLPTPADRWHREQSRHASDTASELQAGGRENRRRLASSPDQRRRATGGDEELERLRLELASASERAARGRSADEAMRDQCERNRRQLSAARRQLESLRRLNSALRNERAAVEALANETRLRQLNQLRNKSAEIERLRQKLDSGHRQRQQQQQRQLHEADLLHLGN